LGQGERESSTTRQWQCLCRDIAHRVEHRILRFRVCRDHEGTLHSQPA
jgi:hypothetical protein